MKREKFQYLVKVFVDKTRKALSKLVKGASALAGEALSACEAKKAASDIQAQGYLRNAQRIAIRETPVLVLNQVQASQLESQTFNGFGMYPGPIQLDHAQSEQVFQHMLLQHTLDADSKRELAEAVTPLVGIPALMQSVYKAHECIGRSLVLTYINHGKPDEYKRAYADIVNAPLYEGTNHGLRLRYNLHSADLCEKFCGEYRKSRQYNAGLENELRRMGVQIARVRADGIYLEVYLKWG